MEINKTWFVVVGVIIVLAISMNEDKPKMSQQGVGYTGITNAITARYGEFHLAQGFTVSETQEVNMIKLKLGRSGTIGDIEIGLRDDLTQPDLVTTIMDGNSLPESVGMVIPISIESYTLEENKDYFLVLRADEGNATENYLWVKLNSEDQYGGDLYSSGDWGKSWSIFKDGNYDMYFELR